MESLNLWEIQREALEVRHVDVSFVAEEREGEVVTPEGTWVLWLLRSAV